MYPSEELVEVLKPLNQISKFSVVLGAILLTTMGIGLAPARANMLRESNSLMLHPAFLGMSSFDSKSSSGTDPTTTEAANPTVAASNPTTTGSTDPVAASNPTTTEAVNPTVAASDPTTTGSTDPIAAPEPTYTVGVLAFGVLGLGFAWKAFSRTK